MQKVIHIYVVLSISPLPMTVLISNIHGCYLYEEIIFKSTVKELKISNYKWKKSGLAQCNPNSPFKNIVEKNIVEVSDSKVEDNKVDKVPEKGKSAANLAFRMKYWSMTTNYKCPTEDQHI